MKQNILIVDDDTGVLSALNMLLKSEGFMPVIAQSPDQALTAIRKQDISLVLMDLNYSQDTTSGEEGLQLVNSLRQIDETVPIVVMTGWGTIEVAVDIMKNGANDFLQKPWENDRLLAIIRNQTELACSQRISQRLSRQNQLLREESELNNELVVESDIMRKVIDTLKQVAKSDVSVLLTGENGTGKSLFARYLHDQSPRRENAQVSVNMGAVTEALFESEMFGHVKGAFTDAKSTRIGRFELADEGTLFLDEIGDMPLNMQVKILRVLQERCFERVGANKTQAVNVRVIAATHRNLEQMITDGGFREDLYYRLNVFPIEMPSLRERTEDIPLLLSELVSRMESEKRGSIRFNSAAIMSLCQHEWSGNVRELANLVERMAIMHPYGVIGVQDLPKKYRHVDVTDEEFEFEAGEQVGQPNLVSMSDTALLPDQGIDLKEYLTKLERNLIQQALDDCGGIVARAADRLSIRRTTLVEKMRKYELQRG